MKNITPEELTTLQENGGKIVVDYWAEWCGPCKILIPTLEGIEGDYSDVTFVKINVDDNSEHAQAQKIRGIPTVIYYDGTTEKDRTTGALPSNQIKEIIDHI